MNTIAQTPTIVHDLALEQIRVTFGNDRTVFDDAKLQALADSIRENGLAQPITVRQLPDGAYQLIAGERRFRAHKLLNLSTIRAIINVLTDEQAAAIMLAENTGRENLDAMDEANAYLKRIDLLGWDVKTVAEKAGVSVTLVNNRLKLRSLRPELQHLIRTGNLPIKYGEVIADAELDNNRQLIAIRRLQECPAPTYTWFHRQCCDLAEDQAQNDMFGDTLFVDFSATLHKQAFTAKTPAHPYKDTAPIVGATPREVIAGQITFWLHAADQWDRYGKRPLRQACKAIADNLQPLLDLLTEAKALAS